MTEEFNKWWDEDDLTTQGNPYTYGTPVYWAWEGWQAALAAPTSAEYAMGYAEGFNDGCKPAPTVRPVAFLANGTRFKISYDSRQSGGQIHGIPPELGGRWVAFVEAEDDCHLKLATPPAAQRQWVGLTDEEIEKACVPLGAAILSFTEVARAIEAKLKEKNT